MIIETFLQLSFIQKQQRFGNATAGAGKTGKQAEGAERLLCFNMAMLPQHKCIGEGQYEQGSGYGQNLLVLALIRGKVY